MIMWNVRTLRAVGKLVELVHEMVGCKWNILILYKIRWKQSGDIETDKRHRVN